MPRYQHKDIIKGKGKISTTELSYPTTVGSEFYNITHAQRKRERDRESESETKRETDTEMETEAEMRQIWSERV